MSQSKTEELTPESVPDLYRLLELAPLESDVGKVEDALKLMVAKARAAKSTDAKLAQRAARIFELGKHHLLAPQRKAAYDRRWQKVYGKSATGNSAGTAKTDWDTSKLTELLPSGNPNEPFNLAEFLQVAASLPEMNPSADFEKLQSLLAEPKSTAQDITTQQSTAQDVTAQVSMSGGESPPPPVPTDNSSSPATGTLAAGGSGGAVGASQAVKSTFKPGGSKRPPQRSLAKKMRQKRDRTLLMTLAGVLLSLAVVLGVLFLVLNPGAAERDRQQPGPAVAVKPEQNPGDSPSSANNRSSAPRPSGLPRVTGLDEPPDNSTGPDASDGPENNPGVAESNPPGPGAMQNPSQTASMSGDPVQPPTGPFNPPTELTPTEPTLTEDDKAAWQAIMTEIRTLLGEQAYDTAGGKLTRAKTLAKTAPQREQLTRLNTVSKLAKEYHDELVQAIAGLSAGETFKVKTTDVSFVGGSDQRVTIRMRGQNQAFDLTEIPIGLAHGLVDLRMDLIHPTSLARKAAFTLLHPANNDLVLSKARQMMSSAAADGAVPKDTPAAFDDDYRL